MTGGATPGPASRGPATSRRRGAAKGNGDPSPTRERVIAAALDAIHTYGYRHATSNKIAHHAGVTWGVIQYYFGTRERLLLAVLTQAIDDVERRIDALDGLLPGTTFDERYDAWESLVLDSFGYTLFPGVVQIALDLGRDPTVGDETIAELERYNETIRRLADLAAQLGGEVKLSPALGDYIYWSSWSSALAHSMNVYLMDTEDVLADSRRQSLRAATAALVADAAARH